MAKVRLLDGKPLMVDGKVAISDDCCCGDCFEIAVSATVSGSANVNGVVCAICTPIAVSGSISGPGETDCCNDGEPIPGCDNCDECSFNSQNASFSANIAPCGALCSQAQVFSAYVELDHFGPDYELFVRGTIPANFGTDTPPDPCVTTVCSIFSDPGNTYVLGADPTGTHLISFAGSVTGASYSFTIIIS